MVNVQITEEDLLKLFVERLKFWTNDDERLALYEHYLEALINEGCFDNTEINTSYIIDNLYINDTQIMTPAELKENDIDKDNSDKVLACNEDQSLFLVSSY